MTGDGSGAKNKRLDVLNHSNDGFFIANEDLKLRGPGDLFGIRQSGDLDFGLGDIYQDSDVLMLAGELADQVLSGDVVLPENSDYLKNRSTIGRSDRRACKVGAGFAAVRFRI